MQNILFFTRFVLYILLACVPYLLSAAIAVQYDRTAKITYFFLVPAQMLIAFFLSYKRTKKIWAGPLTGFGLLVFSLFFSEFSFDTILQFSLMATLAYVWTLFVFSNSRGRFFAVLELFAFAFIYYKLLNFTRASEQIAIDTGKMVHIVLFLAAITFLTHAIVLYMAAFVRKSHSSGRRRKELLAFLMISIPLLLVVSFALPASFLHHNPLETELDDEPPPKGEQLNEDSQGDSGAQGGRPPDEGNGLPLGDGQKKYPSDRQQGGGSEDQGDIPENEKRPDEKRGGGKDSGKDKSDKGGKNGADKQNQDGQSGQGQQGGKQQNQDGQGNSSGQNQGKGQKGRDGGQQGQNQDPNQGSEGQQKQEQGNQGQQQDQKKDKQRLEGIPSDQWNNRQQMSGANNKQFAVMVIASPVDPVYAAQEYRGTFDRKKGFQRTNEKEEPLNLLAKMRLLETWKDKIFSADDKRKAISTYYISTLPDRVLAYRPYEIQPSIRDVVYEPFSYSYNAISRMSLSGPKDWELVLPLSDRRKEMLKNKLELDASEDVLKRYHKYNQKLRIQKKDKPFLRLEKILKGFKTHQYKMGFEENSSPEDLARFLLDSKEGDCTEFANSAALLARLNDMPSRVVHGYLGSKDLQTRYHRGGIKHLQKKIKPLQKFKMQELYLITTSHRHAWIQVYFAGYGWIDFETTAFAIKPKDEFNPNKMDVVIPLIQEKQDKKVQKFSFPWRLAGKVLAGFIILAIIALYTIRFVREVYFYICLGTKSRRGLRSYLILLLMQMARDRYEYKGPHLTPLEYATSHESLKNFAKIYATLRFKENYSDGQFIEIEQQFKNSWKTTRKALRKPGFWNAIRRGMSLRGLYY